MRLLFAGTPSVAIPSLRYLAERHDIVGVLTRAPAPQGRKRIITPSPVHEAAQELGIPVMTPASLKNPDTLAQLNELKPDAVAVVAYGLMIPSVALDIARLGWFNLHFSALPRWRGAAPVQYALAAGETTIGTSVFRIDEGLDTGPIVSTVMHECDGAATADTVLEFLAEQGAGQLHEALCSVHNGTAVLTEQIGTPTYAPSLSTKDSRIQWNAPADVIRNKIRAFTPEPGTWTTLAGQRIKIGPVETADIASPAEHSAGKRIASSEDTLSANIISSVLRPGEIKLGKKIMVGTSTLPIILGDVTPSGKKTMPAQAWAHGLQKNHTYCFESEIFPSDSAAADTQVFHAERGEE